MSGKVIKLSDYAYKWREIYRGGSEGAMLYVYINDGTGELEIVQVDPVGKVLRTALSTVDSVCFASLISRGHDAIKNLNKK